MAPSTHQGGPFGHWHPAIVAAAYTLINTSNPSHQLPPPTSVSTEALNEAVSSLINTHFPILFPVHTSPVEDITLLNTHVATLKTQLALCQDDIYKVLAKQKSVADAFPPAMTFEEKRAEMRGRQVKAEFVAGEWEKRIREMEREEEKRLERLEKESWDALGRAVEGMELVEEEEEKEMLAIEAPVGMDLVEEDEQSETETKAPDVPESAAEGVDQEAYKIRLFEPRGSSAAGILFPPGCFGETDLDM
ncbi:hypothetical protein P154DRAFT_537299 [Amniculicola lignicola CBS 123094]|uniref:Uncharacterized protein n=1 Tax=Amniculicola lignicola CBS 123094 TaxID=1392246 RepID=A0A6A5W7K2_9PLEO|nr:hypothetical protein P154DRAFT_537299 [Amniculicola lignicola CBS 123094]